MENKCKSCKNWETENCYLYDFLLMVEQKEEKEGKEIVFSLEVESCPNYEEVKEVKKIVVEDFIICDNTYIDYYEDYEEEGVNICFYDYEDTKKIVYKITDKRIIESKAFKKVLKKFKKINNIK